MILSIVFLFLPSFCYCYDLSIIPVKVVYKSKAIDIEDAPYQVALERRVGKKFIHICAGAIIHREWAITAASCVFPQSHDHGNRNGGDDNVGAGGDDGGLNYDDISRRYFLVNPKGSHGGHGHQHGDYGGHGGQGGGGSGGYGGHRSPGGGGRGGYGRPGGHRGGHGGHHGVGNSAYGAGGLGRGRFDSPDSRFANYLTDDDYDIVIIDDSDDGEYTIHWEGSWDGEGDFEGDDDSGGSYEDLDDYGSRTFATNANSPTFPSRELRLRSGASSLLIGGTVHSVQLIITHPKYSKTTKDYNVAIIKVSTPFSYCNAVKRVLMSGKSPTLSTQAVISGWIGSPGRKPSTMLSIANVIVLGNKQCKQEGIPLTPRMFCLKEQICVGETGGSVIIGNKLAGIVACHSTHTRDGFYTDVAKIHDWVVSTISTNTRYSP